MHTIKPLDHDAVIKAAKETGAIVTAEDHQKHGGLGGAVAELLAQTFPTPQEFVAVNDFSVVEEILSIEENWTMAHIMFAAGVFSSVGDARRNNWNKPIPLGFSDFKGLGKNKIRVTIFKENINVE